ncbi:MAG: hydrogenase maturation protease, partial [Bacteroidota bacterium]
GRTMNVLIICVGNRFRSDDALGHAVADVLRTKSSPHTTIIEENGEGAVLMDRWKDAEAVILVDAVSSGAEPGTLYRFDVHEAVVPSKFFHYSTHAFSVAEAVELARALNHLPPKMILYGVEGKHFRAGLELSKEVWDAVPKIVQSITDDLTVLV